MTARCGGKLLPLHLRRRPYDRCGQGKGEGDRPPSEYNLNI